MKKIIIAIAAAALVLAGCASTGKASGPDLSTADFDVKAIAYYDFETPITDGDLEDASGNDMIALVNGEAALVEGKYGQALKFNGIDTSIQLPNEVQDSDEWTFAAWVKADNWKDWARVCDFGDGASMDIWLGFSGVEKQMRFDIFGNGAALTLLGPVLVPGQWSHIAFTFGNGTASLYINGKMVGTRPFGLRPRDIIKQNALVGASNWMADPLFAGAMDDVFISGTVLDAKQVRAVMNGITIAK